MKLFIGCALVLGLSAVAAMAGDGRLSQQSLAKVGLGGMALLSDPQGLEIRGLGVSEGTYGDQGDHGEKDHHQKGEKYKHHENKQHEHKHPECHDHQHEKCGQSVCHVSSLCHVECTAHTR